MSKIRVLIVDDSAIIRSLLQKFLSTDPGIEVVGTAPDPFIARDKIVELKPDVITLDIEMPKMDGITFLEKLMAAQAMRVLVISSLSTHGSETAMRALELGAIDVMAKPAIDVTKSMEALGAEIVARVKAVATATPPQFIRAKLRGRAGVRPTAAASAPQAMIRTTHQILAIAASTGGTEALRYMLPELPPDLPGAVLVQHMPPVFTKTFADSLARICPFEVREAADGDRVMPGLLLVAPGNYHMELVRSGAIYQVRLHQEPMLHGVRPAADYLFRSVAKTAGKNAIGVILTGMGRDGADGLKVMRDAGAYTLAQSEDTCVVYGMPKAAVEIGAIDDVLPLDEIARAIMQTHKKREAA